jgi:hypothetical protein
VVARQRAGDETRPLIRDGVLGQSQVPEGMVRFQQLRLRAANRTIVRAWRDVLGA